MKLLIFLFEILKCLTWFSKLRIGLTQFWSPNLFNCLARILTLPIKYEMILGTFWTNMETQEYFVLPILAIALGLEI